MPENLFRMSYRHPSFKQCDLMLSHAYRHEILVPGEVIGPFIRDYYVIRYCVSGHGKLVIDNVEFEINAGQTYVLSPGVIISEEVCGNEEMVLSALVLYGMRAETLFKNMGITEKSPFFPWTENPEFHAFMCDVCDKVLPIHSSSSLFLTAQAYLVIDYLTRYMQSYYSDMSHDNQIEAYIQKAVYYIDLSYTEQVKISDIAKYVGLNRSYFSCIFKERMGVSPQEYITQLRIRKACELLSYPDATVISVANSLNYDPAAFFRHFKRIIGLSPSEYKKKLDQGITL